MNDCKGVIREAEGESGSWQIEEEKRVSGPWGCMLCLMLWTHQGGGWWNTSVSLAPQRSWVTVSCLRVEPDWGGMGVRGAGTRVTEFWGIQSKLRIYPECGRLAQYWKSINVNHHISRPKKKSHMIISIVVGKAFDQIQHLITIKTMSKLGLQGNFLTR